MKIKFFLVIFLLPLLAIAQQNSEFLKQTIIVKVKEQYRSVCAPNEIKNAQFIKAAQAIGVSKIELIFPHHQRETSEGRVDLSLIYQLTYTEQFNEQEVANKMSRLNVLAYAEPYVIPQLAYTPNDSIILADTTKIWHLKMINAFNAWNITKGDTTVVIGITDTGWDSVHPDLVGNAKKNYNDPINGFDDDGDGYIDNFIGWDLGSGDNDAQLDGSNHGTHVSGLAAAVSDNIIGVASIGFNSKFLPIKISNAAGSLTHAYQGVVYAADHGCFIINCSWGSTTPGQFQKDVIDYAIINKGCLVIGACGNSNNEILFYPAAYDGVLTVAASEELDLKKNNSNYGYYVDISAPGENMWSTMGGSSYGINGGTSMAAPVVSGAAALVKAMHPGYTNQQVAALLRATAFDMNPLNPTFFDKLGNGRLDVNNALTALSPQFVELVSTGVNDHNDNIFIETDTLRIVGIFTNYLSAISGLNVTISSSSPYVSILDASTSIPNLNTMESYVHGADPFLVQVLNGAPFNEQVLFKAVITNGTYTVNEYFSVTLNPDYINLEENQIKTTITSKGKIGFNDVSNSVGLGFSFNGEPLLYEAGLMVGTAATQVSDCVRGVSGQDLDFQSLINVKYNPPYVSALDLIGKMDDATYALSLNVGIEQKSYAYSSAPNDKFVIVRYLLKNEGLSTLNNLSLGLFADWDIQNYALNASGLDATRKMGYVRSLESDSLYAAIKLLTNGTFVNYSLDNISGGAGGVDITNGFTTAEKYTTLSTNKLSAGLPAGQDVAHVVSSGNFTLNANDSVEIAFALIAGNGLTDIQASSDAAQIIYETIIGVEEVEENNLFTIYPNPTKGIVILKINQFEDLNIKNITIYNVYGAELFPDFQINSASNIQIDLTPFANGIYFVEVYTNNVKYIKKLVLNK